MKGKSSLAQLYQAKYLNAALSSSLHCVSANAVRPQLRPHSLMMRPQKSINAQARMAVRMVYTPPLTTQRKPEPVNFEEKKVVNRGIANRKYVRKMMQESYKEMSILQSSLGGEITLKQLLQKHFTKKNNERMSREANIRLNQYGFQPLRPARSRYGGRDLRHQLKLVEGKNHSEA